MNIIIIISILSGIIAGEVLFRKVDSDAFNFSIIISAITLLGGSGILFSIVESPELGESIVKVAAITFISEVSYLFIRVFLDLLSNWND